MKNKDLKKGKESIIGKIIYSFLLFMPLLAILSTILVNTFNKEVTQPTQQAEITYKYETNEVNSFDDLIVGNAYHFSFDNLGASNYDELFNSGFFACYSLGINKFYINDQSIDSYYIDELYLQDVYSSLLPYLYFSTNYVMIQYPNNESYLSIELDFLNYDYEYAFDFDFVLSSYEDLDLRIVDYLSVCENIPIESVEITTHDTSVNDIFYYAVDKVEQSNLFNWSKNSIIYTGIHNTCTQLSITTTFVPMLLAYWLIISVIYILYDIILMILIILHNRVHRLQESI